jgi:hypothetical protein
MKNIIRKELNEIKSLTSNLVETIDTDESLSFYHQKLIELSNRTASGFSIEGDLPIVTIKFGKFNLLFGTLFFLLLGFFITGAIINKDEPIFLLLPIVIVATAILHAKYWSLANKITLDCKNKVLVLESNHWLGRHLGGKILIRFSAIKSFDKELKRYRVKGQMTHFRYRITLITYEKKHKLFEIPHGPIYYINENTMIDSIKGIIKNGVAHQTSKKTD